MWIDKGGQAVNEALRFYRDAQTGVPRFEPKEDTYSALGSLLTGDIANSNFALLEFLEGIDRVRLGTSTHEEWEGNGWSGDIRPDGLHLQDLHSEDWRGDYSLDLAWNVAMDYLRFLLSDQKARASALERWEAVRGRAHPARGDM